MSAQNQPTDSLTEPTTTAEVYEHIDAPELARRLNLPESWIWDGTRRRARDRDPIPCLRWGRYVRFEWLCPELKAWIARHRQNYTGTRK